MERHRAALSTLSSQLAALQVAGHTDLVLGNLKCSGNSQRRRKRFLLFHGTFLLRLDLSLVETLLPLPSRQPAYRQNRSHRKFLINLDLPAESIKNALRTAWGAAAPVEIVPAEAISLLVRDKYAAADWNFKF